MLNMDEQTPGIGRAYLSEPASPTPVVSGSFYWNGDPSTQGRFLVDPSGPSQAAQTATFQCTEFSSDRLKGVVNTSWGTTAALDLYKIDAFTTHTVAHLANSWEQLGTMLGHFSVPGRKWIFRGQRDKRWHLESRFHRLGRRDLRTYKMRDVEELRRLFAAEERTFDTSDPASLASLIHLGQHHAFPTPWLDWTESAYTAIFFAFEQRSPARDDDQFARLYIIETTEWPYAELRVASLESAVPYVFLSKPLPQHNRRAVSQQAVVMATNIARPEWYITHYGLPVGRAPAITVIEMPWSLRKRALAELARMNIGPRQVHGGLDGIGMELSQRYFDPACDQ
ncbi:MAG: FRG domain-containing protein [Burkholderiales bacterium]